jgi:hypothetical protein
MLLVKADPIGPNLIDEIRGPVLAQREPRKQRILAEISGDLGTLEIRKIAATTTGDSDLFSQARCMVNQHDPRAAQTRLSSAVHAGSASPDDRDVKGRRVMK